MSAAAGMTADARGDPGNRQHSLDPKQTPEDPQNVGHNSGHHNAAGTGAEWTGPATRRIIVGYGFWLFLLSDFVLFAALFATYAVLRGATDGGPGARELFRLDRVAIETACLLASSFMCGMASIAASVRKQLLTQLALLATGLLGFAFIVLEIMEFSEMISQGAGPARSAFLSAFFTLVGSHGLHVSAGLLWLGTMMAQIYAKGFRPDIMRRLLCFSLFWHALDIVWIAIFTVVYLLGVL